MAQQSLEDVSMTNLPQFAKQDLGIDEMKPGLLFADENSAVDAVLKWGNLALCPLTKTRRKKGLSETDGKVKGRRCIDCPHGRKKQETAQTGVRPSQTIKHTKVNSTGTFYF